MAKEKKATAVVIDFTNVKDRGAFNPKHQTAGDYKGEITKVIDTTKKDDATTKMWVYTIRVGTGTYPYRVTYEGENAENQYWKIRNLQVAAGINVPKKRMKVDPNAVVGKYVGVTLEDDEYDGRMKSVVQSVFPTSELDGSTGGDDAEENQEEESVEAPQGSKKEKKGKKGKKGKKASGDELEELEIEDI